MFSYHMKSLRDKDLNSMSEKGNSNFQLKHSLNFCVPSSLCPLLMLLSLENATIFPSAEIVISFIAMSLSSINGKEKRYWRRRIKDNGEEESCYMLCSRNTTLFLILSYAKQDFWLMMFLGFSIKM